MVDAIESVEFILVATEAEALLTEQNFIKQYRPRFNIRLRDDKSYPFIAISIDEDVPARLLHARAPPQRAPVLRPVLERQARARDARPAREGLPCSAPARAPSPAGARGSPCLDYYIKRCGAPCVGYVDKEQYREAIDGVVAFLSGRYREIERDLEERMKAAAAAQRVREGRARAQPPARGAPPARAPARRERVGRHARHRRGRRRRDRRQRAGLPGPRRRPLRPPVLLPRERGRAGAPARSREEFMLQYYGDADVDPAADRSCSRRSRRTSASSASARRAPRRAGSRCAPPSAATSAASSSSPSATPQLALEQEKLKAERRRQQRVEALDDLQEELALDALPLRIECFDISNLMGTHTVASMVVFEGGAPKKSDYRRFTIRGARGGRPDDFAAMEEVLAAGSPSGSASRTSRPHDPKRNESLRDAAEPHRDRRRPGPARRGARARSQGFRERGRRDRLAGQAHRGDLHRPGGATPLVLGHDTPELQLLQRVRDEAHRFAITHHRTRRDRAMTTSLLDELPGVGPARKRALLSHFGSPEAVVAATREQLEAVPGLPGKSRGSSTRICTGPGDERTFTASCPTPTTHSPHGHEAQPPSAAEVGRRDRDAQTGDSGGARRAAGTARARRTGPVGRRVRRVARSRTSS